MRLYRAEIPDCKYWQKRVLCQVGCPVSTDAGRYVQLIAEGRIKDAYLTARSPNPLASVCGRVCAAPCEDRCRRGFIDAPISIRALKRFLCERYGAESSRPDTVNELFGNAYEPGNKYPWHIPLMTRSGSGRRVAVIGAGPAGLACAHDLALMGYKVTLFESAETLGGMLRLGIPEYRLPRSVIEMEIAEIVALGVELKTSHPVGPDFGLAALRRAGHEAVFIGVGVQRGRGLSVPGVELDGVVKAIDFLLNVNRGYRMRLGSKVLVIGGGFVAFDAARMALREISLEDAGQGLSGGGDLAAALDSARVALRTGAGEVHMASLEAFDEMPVMKTFQGKDEFEQATREGITFHPRRGPLRFEGDRVIRRAVLQRVTRVFDETGRFSPEYDPRETETFEVDAVILAIGQMADLSFIRPEDGIALTAGGTIKVDAGSMATSAPGIYAGGDVAFGPRILIDAVANGKRAAQSIREYLDPGAPRIDVMFRIEQLQTSTYRMPEEYEIAERSAPPSLPLDRRTGISEVELGYGEAEAKRQAERCLTCHVNTIYDAEKCVLCNRCVDICPEDCLKLVPLSKVELQSELEPEILESYALAEGETASVMLKDDTRCIRCGLCAIRCPTSAWTMERMYFEEKARPVTAKEA
ncbi:MAG: FAD-dependent oxidoreductase [Acidobacteriota bacterium]